MKVEAKYALALLFLAISGLSCAPSVVEPASAPLEEKAESRNLAGATGSITFKDGSQAEHMSNFMRISDDLKVYEDEYAACLRDIADAEYCESRVNECVGKNFIKVVLDIKYETLKIMAKADTRVREFFIQECYSPAGTVEEFSVGCDNMERDCLDLLWNGIDFVQMLEANRDKYLVEYGKIPEEHFKAVMGLLGDFAKDFFQIIDEVDAHKEVTILKLKTLIDDRTKLMLEEAKLHPDMIKPALIHHTIEIKEQISGGDPIEVHELPQQQLPDDDTFDFDTGRKMKQTGASAQQYLESNHNERQRKAAEIKSQAFARRAPLSQKEPAPGDDGRLNSRRIFNSSNNYSGLHAKHSNSGRFAAMASGIRNRAFRENLMSRMNPGMGGRAGAGMGSGYHAYVPQNSDI